MTGAAIGTGAAIAIGIGQSVIVAVASSMTAFLGSTTPCPETAQPGGVKPSIL